MGVLLTLCTLFLGGCLGTGEERSTVENPPRKGEGQSSAGATTHVPLPAAPSQIPRSDAVVPTQTKEEHPFPSPGPVKGRVGDERLAKLQAGPHIASRDGKGVWAESITGYATPAEYLGIESRHIPTAVVAVMLPVDYQTATDKEYPLVIAFGGAGECAKAPRQGALAWMHYYRSDEAVRALGNGELTPRDFRGLVTPQTLAVFNQRLRDRPYHGVILACPASPLLSIGARSEFPEYEAFIVHELIPALMRRYRVAPGRIGIDGVSMGGTRSMYYGFKYPELFSSIGSVQGAFGGVLEIYRELIRKNKTVLKERAIQLVTSDGDVMAPSVERLHDILREEGIPHSYLKLTGPHDYVFNQGPGTLSLLLFHSQALPPPLVPNP